MSKKHLPYTQPLLVQVADRSGDELLAAFPSERRAVTVGPADAALLRQMSERARLRAAAAQHEQRETRTRREAQQILAAADRPAPTVREDLKVGRQRPWDAPMATPINSLPLPPAPMIGGLPDPLAALAWDAVATDTEQAVRSWWERWQFTVALSVWSVACFLLGMFV